MLRGFAPKFSAKLDLTWSDGPYTLHYGLAWQDRTRRFELETLAGNPDIAAPEYLTYKERWEHDLQLRIAPSDRYSFYVGVNNLTDEEPAFAAVNTPVTALGRYFYAGASISLDSIF
jgi:iron complex outermembrane receptor protein